MRCLWAKHQLQTSLSVLSETTHVILEKAFVLTEVFHWNLQIKKQNHHRENVPQELKKTNLA